MHCRFAHFFVVGGLVVRRGGNVWGGGRKGRVILRRRGRIIRHDDDDVGSVSVMVGVLYFAGGCSLIWGRGISFYFPFFSCVDFECMGVSRRRYKTSHK